MAQVFLDIRPGLVEDDTSFKVGQGGYIDASNVRFWNGAPQAVGGWERVTLDSISGTPRALLDFNDNAGDLNIAIATNEKLYVERDGLADITPSGFVAGRASNTGGAGYGTGTYGTGTWSSPSAAEFFAMTWSLAAYGETLIANPRGQTIYQWTNDKTVPASSLGRTLTDDDDLTSYADQTAFDVAWTRGTGWTFDAGADAADCDGTQTAASNLTRSATVVSGERYRVEIDYTRTAGSLAALGGSRTGESAEADSGTVFVGFKASSTSESIGVVADADFVGSITQIRWYRLAAPDQVSFISVPPNKRHVIAYGVNEEISDVYNPRCIRHSDFEDLSEWTTRTNNNAGETVLDSEGVLVGALEAGEGAFVWTDTECYYRSFVGAPDQTYRYDRIGVGCGLIGPNAATQIGPYVYWMAPNVQFWRCAVGGIPEPVVSPVGQQLKANLNIIQSEKVTATSIVEWQEVRWHYPDERDGDGEECSRYIMLNVTEGAWSKGDLARSAANDAGPSKYPLLAAPTGEIYYHEKGTSADGGLITARLETGDIYVRAGGRNIMVRSVWPDLRSQMGAVNLIVSGRQFPQGSPREEGPFAMPVNKERISCRVTGRMIRMKFTSQSSPSQWRLGRISVDIEERGRR